LVIFFLAFFFSFIILWIFFIFFFWQNKKTKNEWMERKKENNSFRVRYGLGITDACVYCWDDVVSLRLGTRESLTFSSSFDYFARSSDLSIQENIGTTWLDPQVPAPPLPAHGRPWPPGKGKTPACAGTQIVKQVVRREGNIQLITIASINK
jgi:hypothetical protein